VRIKDVGRKVDFSKQLQSLTYCLLYSPSSPSPTCPNHFTALSVRNASNANYESVIQRGLAWVVLTPTTTATTLLACRRRSLVASWLGCPCSWVVFSTIPVHPGHRQSCSLQPDAARHLLDLYLGDLIFASAIRSKNSWLPRGSCVRHRFRPCAPSWKGYFDRSAVGTSEIDQEERAIRYAASVGGSHFDFAAGTAAQVDAFISFLTRI